MTLSAALQQTGPYLAFWNPDFLSEVLHRNGTVARYYPDTRTAIDVGRPKSKLSQRKSQLLSLRGIRYLCLPRNFKGWTLPMGKRARRFPRLA